MRRMMLGFIIIASIMLLGTQTFTKAHNTIYLNSRYADLMMIESLMIKGECIEIEPGVFAKNGYTLNTNTNEITVNGQPVSFSNTTVDYVHYISAMSIIGQNGISYVNARGIQVVLTHRATRTTTVSEQFFVEIGD